jgi:hypothetical protein
MVVTNHMYQPNSVDLNQASNKKTIGLKNLAQSLLGELALLAMIVHEIATTGAIDYELRLSQQLMIIFSSVLIATFLVGPAQITFGQFFRHFFKFLIVHLILLPIFFLFALAANGLNLPVWGNLFTIQSFVVLILNIFGSVLFLRTSNFKEKLMLVEKSYFLYIWVIGLLMVGVVNASVQSFLLWWLLATSVYIDFMHWYWYQWLNLPRLKNNLYLNAMNKKYGYTTSTNQYQYVMFLHSLLFNNLTYLLPFSVLGLGLAAIYHFQW